LLFVQKKNKKKSQSHTAGAPPASKATDKYDNQEATETYKYTNAEKEPY
jgi:hypothetical protein